MSHSDAKLKSGTQTFDIDYAKNTTVHLFQAVLRPLCACQHVFV